MKNSTLQRLLTLLHESKVMYRNELLYAHLMKLFRTGNHKPLEIFLKTHPELLEQAFEITEARKRLRKAVPFEIPEQSDFDGMIPVGIINSENETFRLSENNLTRHMLILGLTGAGKTNLMTVIVSSIQRVLPETTVWIFEPKREYRALPKLLDDYIVITPQNFMQNFFEPPTSAMKPLDWAMTACGVIQVSARFMTFSKAILFDVVKHLYKKNGVLEGSTNYPTVEDALRYVYSCKTIAQQKRDYNKAKGYDTLINRLTEYVNLGTVFNVRRSVPIEALMHKNIIFETENLTDENYYAMISLLLSKAYHYRFHHSFNHKIMIVVEEARKVFSSKKDSDYTNVTDPTMVNLMTLVRGKDICLDLVTQEPSSISKVAKAGVNTQILLKMFEGDEVKSACRTMGLSEEQRRFINKMEIGMGICRYVDYPEPFLIQIPYIEMPDVLSDTEVEEKAKAWQKSIGYSPEPEQPEVKEQPEKPAESEPEPEKQQGIPHECVAMLRYLSKHPFTHYTELIKACEITADKGKKAREWLKENGYANLHNDIKTSARRNGTYFQLTEKALKEFKAKPPKGKGSFKHCRYAQKVAEVLQEAGMAAEVECYLDGKHIDVYCKNSKTAYEITLNFSNMVDNIEKNSAAGAENTVVIVESQTKERKAKRLLKERPDITADIELIGKYFQKGDKKDVSAED